jgi:hypothetical protein
LHHRGSLEAGGWHFGRGDIISCDADAHTDALGDGADFNGAGVAKRDCVGPCDAGADLRSGRR